MLKHVTNMNGIYGSLEACILKPPEKKISQYRDVLKSIIDKIHCVIGSSYLKKKQLCSIKSD